VKASEIVSQRKKKSDQRLVGESKDVGIASDSGLEEQ
jgi:hypothetical protein